MKRILISLAIACMALCTYAQKNLPVGIRSEITEIEQNDDTFSLFQYKDPDQRVGYYLSLLHTNGSVSFEILEMGNTSISSFDECCLYLGENYDQVLETLTGLVDLFSEPSGTTRELEARRSNGAEGLADSITVNCILRKGLLGKHLAIQFEGRKHPAEVQLSKSSVKSLISGVKFYRKLHPEK